MGYFDEILDSLGKDTAEVSLESALTPELEAELFIMAMEQECTPEEFQQLVTESAIDLEIYKILPDSSMVEGAMEATNYNKKVVTKQTKDLVYNRLHKRTCLRLAEAADTPDWKKYKKGRTMMIEARENIYRRHGSQARNVAKQAMRNSQTKAASMQTKNGNDIVEKMDRAIRKVEEKTS